MPKNPYHPYTSEVERMRIRMMEKREVPARLDHPLDLDCDCAACRAECLKQHAGGMSNDERINEIIRRRTDAWREAHPSEHPQYDIPRLCNCDECTADYEAAAMANARREHPGDCDCAVCRAEQRQKRVGPDAYTEFHRDRNDNVLVFPEDQGHSSYEQAEGRSNRHSLETAHELRSIWHLISFALGVAIGTVGAIAFLLGIIYTDKLMGFGGGAAVALGATMITLSERSKR